MRRPYLKLIRSESGMVCGPKSCMSFLFSNSRLPDVISEDQMCLVSILRALVPLTLSEDDSVRTVGQPVRPKSVT